MLVFKVFIESIYFSAPTVTEKEAKRALEEYIGTKCCYSTQPLGSMKITSLVADHAYRVNEKRQ